MIIIKLPLLLQLFSIQSLNINFWTVPMMVDDGWLKINETHLNNTHQPTMPIIFILVIIIIAAIIISIFKATAKFWIKLLQNYWKRRLIIEIIVIVELFLLFLTVIILVVSSLLTCFFFSFVFLLFGLFDMPISYW